MFCPHCGVENGADANFCRKCGEDLRLTSQAMHRRIGWGEFVSTKFDDLMTDRQHLRDGGVNIFIGIVGMLLAVWYIFTGQGGLIFWTITGLALIAGIAVGAYDVHVYRRSTRDMPRDEDMEPGDLSIFKGATPRRTLPPPAAPTNELGPYAPPPGSVTETTTQHLGAPVPARGRRAESRDTSEK
jgi:hypothetical protein